MDRGDRVLCVYDNAYRYAARVLAKYDNPELASSVWGEGEEGKTWQYMYFLTEPREINTHVSELAGYLNASYFGFTKISDKKLDARGDPELRPRLSFLPLRGRGSPVFRSP
jgi:hypothetical protein